MISVPRTQMVAEGVLRLQPLQRHGEIMTLSSVEGRMVRGCNNPKILDKKTNYRPAVRKEMSTLTKLRICQRLLAQGMCS